MMKRTFAALLLTGLACQVPAQEPATPPPVSPAPAPAIPAAPATPTPAPAPAEAAEPEAEPAPRPLPPRAMLTPGEYMEQASHLRKLYGKAIADWPAPTLGEGVVYQELARLPKVQHPESNPHSPAKEKLGKSLFFDPRLSGSQQLACASCHEPDLTWTDGRTVAIGHHRQRLPRNTPSLLNVGQSTVFFWDGRATTLEVQARMVILDPREMHGNEADIVARLSQHESYRKQFQESFGDETINLDRVSQAIACFERTIVSRTSPLDRFLAGQSAALSDSALRGLHLFRTDARCMNCHQGPTLSDGKFHNLGLSFYGRKLEDLGRHGITKTPEDVGSFKTPPLRNIARTAPYMHNGLFEMDGVLRLYNAGMPTLRRRAEQKDDPLFPTKDKLLQPLGLNQQDLADLKAFMESLTETPVRVAVPDFPPLSTESASQPATAAK